jgi:glycosyltransferase involved in cell wall biosynthesis
MKTKTLCLNMIVKDESDIIRETLENLVQHLDLDYWVISDTGSTDNTQQIILDFFKEKNIPGELFQDTWKDFGHNRTLALEHAYKKSDYLFIFDADDKIIGKMKLDKDELIKEVEELGGMAAAIETGIPKMRIEEAAAKKQAKIDSGLDVIVGVNRFTNYENTDLELREVDNANVLMQQLNKLAEIKENRNNQEVAKLLKQLEKAAKDGKAQS